MALIAHYKLNGDLKDSVGNNHGVPDSSVNYKNGILGKTIDSDNSSAVNIPCGEWRTYSIAFWFKCDTPFTGSFRQFFRKGDNRSPSFWTRSNINRLHLQQELEGGNRGADTVDNFEIEKWHHIVFICDAKEGRTTLSSYMDGKLQQTNAYNEQVSMSGNHFILRNIPDISMDDVRIFDHVLSQREIRDLSQAKLLEYKFQDDIEPTVNGVISPDFSSDMSGYSGVITEILDDPQSLTNKSLKITHDSVESTAARVRFNVLSEFTSGIKTLSVYAKAEDNFIGRYLYTYTGDGWYRFEGGKLENFYKRFHVTAPVSTNSGGPFTVSTRTTDSGTYFVHSPLIEDRDYLTEFTEDERKGVVFDSSTNGNNSELDLNTTPRWVNDPIMGGCYKFNGINSQIVIDRQDYYAAGNTITVAAWVKMDSSESGGAYSGIVSNTPSTGQFNYSIAINDSSTSGKFVASFKNSQVGQLSSNQNIVFGKWYHVCMTSDGSTTILYINGEPDTQKPQTNHEFDNSDIVIGALRTNILDGNIKDVRLYKEALTAEEVKELYQTKASIDENGSLYSQLSEMTKTFSSFEIGDMNFSSVVGTGESEVSINDNHIYMYADARVIESTGSSITFKIPKDNETNLALDLDYRIWRLVESGNNQTGRITVSINNTLLYNKSVDLPEMDYTSSEILNFDISRFTTSELTVAISINNHSSNQGQSEVFLRNVHLSMNKLSDKFYTTKISENSITNGLVAWYPLINDTDDYINRNDGVNNGAVAVSDGYEFETTDDRIVTTDIREIVGNSTSNITFSAWINMTAIDNDNNMFMGQFLPYFALRSNRRILFSTDIEGTQRRVNGSALLELGEWYLTTFTFDNGTMRIYVNGVLDGENASYEGNMTLRSGHFTFGDGQSSNWFPFIGKIRDIRVYDRTLNSNEVARLYNTTKPDGSEVSLTSDVIFIKNQIKEV